MGIAAITTWSANQVLTAAALNANFSTIRDHYNSNALELGGNQTVTGAKTFSALITGSAGATFGAGVSLTAGKLTTVASATGGAGLILPHGTAPSAPVDGDLWSTTSGLFARINGVTAGPFGAGTVTGSGTTGRLTRWSSSTAVEAASLLSVRAYANAVSVANNAVVPFAAESFDNGGFHDNVTNNSRLTVPSGGDGRYVLTLHATITKSPPGGISGIGLKLRKNGADLYSGAAVPQIFHDMDSNGADAPSLIAAGVTALVDTVATDYYEVLHTSGDGTTSTITAGFSMHRID